jgi:Na+/H+ antiporter NhaD/arsenite permease-like protein
MLWFYLMIIIFILGYTAIALEHPLKIDKAASALLIGVLTWVAFIIGGEDVIHAFEGFFGGAHEKWHAFLSSHGAHGEEGAKHAMQTFIGKHELLHHLGEIGEILFFLLGAMTIVEIVDQHEGFKIITDKIKTTKKVKLLWILSVLTFFMSAALDNLTTTIVMVALLRKLVNEKQDRWFFASMIILAANAGGAWSPIGDVTTIMLWVKGNVTTLPIIVDVIVPSLVTMIAPLIILSFSMKGEVQRPDLSANQEQEEGHVSKRASTFILALGVGSLLFVPVFKTITHLPPYMGMLLGLGNLWLITEILHKRRHKETSTKLTVVGILTRVDVPTVLFFLGILLAVASLQSAGHLTLLAGWLDTVTNENIYIINIAIGFLSSIVDNVPLVAGAMGMYDINPDLVVHLSTANLATLQGLGPDVVLSTLNADMLPGFSQEMVSMVKELSIPQYHHILNILPKDLHAAKFFMVDGQFWQFLAYCAGTGGSILIIGSAAGVAAMGMEKIDFIWYLKKISLLAIVGYLAGAATYFLMFGL